jgi:hypothetical protein
MPSTPPSTGKVGSTFVTKSEESEQVVAHRQCFGASCHYDVGQILAHKTEDHACRVWTEFRRVEHGVTTTRAVEVQSLQ